jgi:hypothetical protein
LTLLVASCQADILSDLALQSGSVYTPGQSGYEERRKVMNAACTAQPAVIVVPNFDQDISTIVKAAKANSLELSIRSGGHSYTCTNIKEGGLHLDMRSFNKLEIMDTTLSPTGKALKMGPGRIWGDVLKFAPPEKYSYPHGQCRSVGVGGYLLGGGVNWLGTYNKYGYGAEHILKMKVVLADGSVAWVDKDKTDIFYPAASIRTITHTQDNNLFFALRGAGSSFGVVTEFLYMINTTPEADPAVLLCWVETKADLTAIHNAAKATNDYSITVSQEFANEFWKKELTQVVYELYPDIMEGLKRLNMKSGYPVPLTVTDIQANSGHKTDAAKASDYMKSQGVRMVFELGLTTNVFHSFAEYLYGNNMVEQQNWEAGKYYLSSLNFGGLEDTSSFENIFFNDPSFGVKRNNFLEFASHECDYCFWMIHYRNRQRQTSISQLSPISTNTELENPHVLDTNIVCMFTKANADCPNLIKRVKSQIESNLAGKSYSKYANFPSCSESDWATRYWRNYTQLLDIKNTWDPANQFHHCQSVGSTDNSCCPHYDQAGAGQDKECLGVDGPGAGQPCVFPFSYLGTRYNSCIMGGFGRSWCATSVGIIGAMNSWAYCDPVLCPTN